MENASKALIIAGAILLSILLISLGIMIFNQANGVINSNAMDELEINQFNQKFTQYEGPNVRGSKIKPIIQAVFTNNNAADSSDRKVEVTLDGTTVVDESSSSLSSENAKKIETGSTYNVECQYSSSGGDKGLVNKIVITKNVSSP